MGGQGRIGGNWEDWGELGGLGGQASISGSGVEGLGMCWWAAEPYWGDWLGVFWACWGVLPQWGEWLWGAWRCWDVVL